MEDRQIKQKCSIDLPTQQSMTNLQKAAVPVLLLASSVWWKTKAMCKWVWGKMCQVRGQNHIQTGSCPWVAWFSQLFLAGRTGKTTMTVIAIDWCREIVWSWFFPRKILKFLSTYRKHNILYVYHYLAATKTINFTINCLAYVCLCALVYWNPYISTSIHFTL